MNFNRIEISKIKIKPMGNKIWAIVYFDNGTEWVPALAEQGYIAYAVAKCEEKKYPNLPWDAKKKPRDYLIQCINANSDEEIIKITEQFELAYDKEGKIRDSFLRLLNILKGNS
ncbi:unnamed protein product [marine sediment metagenome]|uniref:Uncharacterized protein n=1 Tax=marine sediment metagenome TaxID=412755 RepID=X1CJ38_9ZZZZ